MNNIKIAILINTPPDSANFQLTVQECWKEALTEIVPTGDIDFYDPVVERKFPDASKYHLIVLSGGKIDADCSEPWVLGVLDYVRITARDFPKTKILAVCWGHQAVSRAFGGQVRDVPTGQIVRG
jgi:GMP synthase-like glutamine amidotransferase